MASRNSLSDDWEDVGDDNLSVVSFSTAEPDADVASVASKSDENSMPVELDASQDQASLQQPPTPTVEPQPQTSSQSQEAAADEKNDAHTQELDSSEQHNPFDDEVDEINQLLKQSTLQSEVDPPLLHSTLESLRDILEDTTQGLGGFVIGLSDIARNKSIAVCDLLSQQVAELLPIASGYAKVWSRSPQDLPIDPNLHEWLTGVRVKMVDFLPIIQVDYNEFQTQYMTIPIARARSADTSAQGGLRDMAINRSDPIDIPQPSSTGSAPSPSYSAEFPQNPHTQLWHLRHELYRLKDLIRQIVETLGNERGLSDSGSALARDIKATYKNLCTTLETALSNHGSDWIDSGLAGGLTYPEFLGLDVEFIRDFTGELEVILNKIPKTYDTCWSYEWGAQLEKLEILAMVLGASLTPNRD
ncbi:hypothetical protein V8F20_009200 [Naviculisporaceae sp. PSN 640]